MTDRELHLPVAAQPSLESLLGWGELAENAGYDRVWAPETWGRDAVTVLSTLAERMEAPGLGTSIIPVYSRSPALVGQTAATLQEACDGQFRLGIGPSGPAVIEQWHGQSFDRPLRRTREYIEIIRTVTSGEELSYDGDFFDVSGFRLRFDPPDNQPPIDVAGMGPTAVELAGRFADGWHALMFTPTGFTDRYQDLIRGTQLGNREPEDVRVTLVVPCAVSPDGNRARELVTRHVAFYIGGMGTFYRDALARQGYETVANEVHDAWTSGNQNRAVRRLDKELVSALTAAGTAQEARSQLRSFAEIDGVDAVAVSLPRGASSDCIETTIRALGPDDSTF